MKNESKDLSGIMTMTHEIPALKKMEIPRDSWWTVLKDIGIATLAVVCFLAGLFLLMINI